MVWWPVWTYFLQKCLCFIDLKKTTLYWKKSNLQLNIPNSHTVPNQDDSSEDYTFAYAGRTVPNGLLLTTANCSQLSCQQRTLFRLLILYPSWKKQISLVFSDTVQDCNMSVLLSQNLCLRNQGPVFFSTPFLSHVHELTLVHSPKGKQHLARSGPVPWPHISKPPHVVNLSDFVLSSSFLVQA